MNNQMPLDEMEVRAWYFARTGKQIRSRSHLAKVTEDYRLLKAVDAVMNREDAE